MTAARDAIDRTVRLLQSGDLAGAGRETEAALRGAPDDPGLLRLWGYILQTQNRFAEAASCYAKVVARDPRDWEIWNNLGNARRAAGDRAGAEQAYRRALDADGRTADAANGLGVLLVEAGRPAEAAPWLERAIAAAPDLVEARLNLGIALQQSGQPARASEAYRQVLAAPARFKRERDAAAKLLAALGDGR